MVLGSSLRNGCVVDKPTFNLARSRRSDGRSISPSCDMQHQAFDVHLVEFHPADLGYAQRMPEDQQQQATVAGFIPAPLRGQIKATIQAAQRQTRLTALQRLDLALLHCQVNNPREFGHSGPSPAFPLSRFSSVKGSWQRSSLTYRAAERASREASQFYVLRPRTALLHTSSRQAQPVQIAGKG
jgi:hypothetical protein